MNIQIHTHFHHLKQACQTHLGLRAKFFKKCIANPFVGHMYLVLLKFQFCVLIGYKFTIKKTKNNSSYRKIFINNTNYFLLDITLVNKDFGA